MPFKVVRNDIIKMKVDAIVNPTNKYLRGTGGVDGAIRKAAGKELEDKCRQLNGCEVGKAKITKGYKLPCKYIIHTAGPLWNGGNENEEQLLLSCYRSSMELAMEYKISSIAFPLISSGHFLFPKKIALDVACKALKQLTTDDITIYLVIYDKETLEIGEEIFDSIEYVIDDSSVKSEKKSVHTVSSMYVENEIALYKKRMLEYETEITTLYEKISANTMRMVMINGIYKDFNHDVVLNNFIAEVERINDNIKKCMQDKIDKISEFTHEIESIDNAQKTLYIQNTDMSFSDLLIHLIDEKGMKDSDVYKAANITKQTFSKIRSNKDYHPKKQVAIALALALRLNLEETQRFIGTAGYVLSNSIKYDMIIKNCILSEEYDIVKINLILMKVLGCSL